MIQSRTKYTNESESGLAGLQVETRLPGEPLAHLAEKLLQGSNRKLNGLENSPGAQPAYINLVTPAFTTILHGHHLLIP